MEIVVFYLVMFAPPMFFNVKDGGGRKCNEDADLVWFLYETIEDNY